MRKFSTGRMDESKKAADFFEPLVAD